MRRLPLSETYNLRDLGDFPINLNQSTKSHQFLRSDALEKVTDSEMKYLSEYGLKLIIDLRNDSEVLKHPDSICHFSEFVYERVPLLNKIKMKDQDNQMAKDLYSRSLNEIYLDIIHSYDEIRTIFNLFKEYQNHCILFHCSAGKDRTGIITFLLLKLAGVSDLDIIADYEVSFTYLLPRTMKLKERFPEMKMHIMESNREVMITFMEYFYQTFGTVEEYLKKIGIDKNIQNIIKNKLI